MEAVRLTTTVTALADTSHTAATENAPCLGAVYVASDIMLSEAERWYADGLHVVRSTEFDCIAEHDDPEEVIGVFTDTALDIIVHLSELADQGEATEHERDTLARVVPRVARWAQKLESEERRRRTVLSRLRRRGETRQWGHRSTPSSSSLPSPV